MKVIVLLYISNLIAILIHECGHLLAAMYVEYKITVFAVGPIGLYRQEGKWKLKLLKNFISGIVAFEKPLHKVSLGNEFLVYSAGIMFNFGVGAILILLYFFTYKKYESGILIIFGTISVFVGLVNVIPMRVKSLNLDTDAVHLIRLYRLAKGNRRPSNQ